MGICLTRHFQGNQAYTSTDRQSDSAIDRRAMEKTKERLIIVSAEIIATLVILSSVTALLYWLTGRAGTTGARWWAVIATMALPVAIWITRRLTSHWAREHLAGFERGLAGAEKTMETVGRGMAATASLARTMRQQQPRNDDLLQHMQLVEAQPGNGQVDL
jgi:hypothetical protein